MRESSLYVISIEWMRLLSQASPWGGFLVFSAHLFGFLPGLCYIELLISEDAQKKDSGRVVIDSFSHCMGCSMVGASLYSL